MYNNFSLYLMSLTIKPISAILDKDTDTIGKSVIFSNSLGPLCCLLFGQIKKTIQIMPQWG